MHLLSTFGRHGLVAVIAILLAACATPMPRKDDPLEGFNRKIYAFNDMADRAVIRPVAVGYRKVTNATTRRLISNFFSNVEEPITIGNDLLQVNLPEAFGATSRFVINTTIGVFGFFDPASELGIHASDTDFGVTLAKWGVPEGPYLVLPLYGPTSLRDVWRLPVDTYFDPIWYFTDINHFQFHAQYLSEASYLVTLRSAGIDAESLLEGAFDPYVFYRDSYWQHRIYKIYRGEPPLEAIQTLQGATELEDADKLIEEQQQYEKQRQQKDDKSGGP